MSKPRKTRKKKSKTTRSKPQAPARLLGATRKIKTAAAKVGMCVRAAAGIANRHWSKLNTILILLIFSRLDRIETALEHLYGQVAAQQLLTKINLGFTMELFSKFVKIFFSGSDS